MRERYDHGRPVSDLSSSILLRPQVCCVLFLGLFDAVTTFEEKETEAHISIVCSFTHGRKCQGYQKKTVGTRPYLNRLGP